MRDLAPLHGSCLGTSDALRLPVSGILAVYMPFATTGICLVVYASYPVPKAPYIRHEGSQYYSPKCMLLPEVRSNIVWCYILLQCMSNASHDWFHACAECIMGARSGAVEEPSSTSKTTSVLLSHKLGLSWHHETFAHDSYYDFSFSSGS